MYKLRGNRREFDEIEELARKSGKEPAEICLEQIHVWKEAYAEYCTDMRSISDEDFEEFLEREMDRRRQDD